MEPQPPPTRSGLTREAILRALQFLSDELGKKNVTGELCIFASTVMVVAFSARVSTRDVDAVFQPAAVIREAAQVIGEAQGLPASWLNDGVKGFISTRHETTGGNLPQFPHLRLTMPVPEYMLAMKCMASRIGSTAGDPSDVQDIVFLIQHLGLSSPAEALDIVERYYPAGSISVKTRYLVEGLFEEGQV